MVAICYSGFTSAAGFDYKQESDTDSPTIWTASYVQSISGHNCMIHLLTSVCAWKCGTCTEMVPAWGKSCQSSSLGQILPFSNQETSSWSTLLTVDIVRSHVWVRDAGNSHCFLSIVAVPPNPHLFLSYVSPDLCSGHLFQRLDELKGTLRGDHFQCLQDHFDWNRSERSPTIHSMVSKHSYPWVNVWIHGLWQILSHCAEEDRVFSALDQKHSN